MKLSVIIPVYNAEKYIEKCLQSVDNQLTPPPKKNVGLDSSGSEFEIIAVNDGSKDNSLRIIEEYAALHPNVRVVSQENKGQSAARNRGIREAKGDWLCFVDADDYWIDNAFAPVLSAMSDDYEIISFGIANEYSKPQISSKTLGPCSGIEFWGRYNCNNGPWWYLIKRALIEREHLQFVEGCYCEDAMFTMTAFLKCKAVVHVYSDVYCYVIHPGSTVTRKDDAHVRKMIYDFLYAIDYLTALINVNKQLMDAACYKSCVERRDSFIFFLFARLLRSRFTTKEIKAVVTTLRNKGLYPFRFMEYKGFKFKLLYELFIHPYLFYIVSFLYRKISK